MNVGHSGVEAVHWSALEPTESEDGACWHEHLDTVVYGVIACVQSYMRQHPDADGMTEFTLYETAIGLLREQQMVRTLETIRVFEDAHTDPHN